MEEYLNTHNTMDLLHKYGFFFKKKYGQNFLCDRGILEKITEAAGITENDHIIEIGPGMGALTQFLCRKAKSVTAVEIDKNLIPILNETLADHDNVRIINADIMKTDLNSLIKDEIGADSVNVVANLPYYITTPIIMMLLESRLPVKRITVMVQSEVARRMKSGPGTKDYGALSLTVQYYSKPEIAFDVPSQCFIPRPEVTSTVITMDVYDKPKICVKDEKFMFKLIRASFNQRRKTLSNALNNDRSLNVGKEDVVRVLSDMGLSENIRGEALTPEQFAGLSDGLSACIEKK
ncbi:MAG: 16S rRNA (adenine(1518)-N(6)/adenine(1519)-N(6))-dimethyltransferase RsmA [Lachnospiraceae bacterium]|nr:16S rRNA (adenine(1518)-N(6)/adenine(1519)-N(6))-dimethyltransferase RsmA [Lachnospiraceae bacterium]